MSSQPIINTDAVSLIQEANGAKGHTFATTKRRRRQYIMMLEGIRELKKLVTSTSGWMRQLHATDGG